MRGIGLGLGLREAMAPRQSAVSPIADYLAAIASQAGTISPGDVAAHEAFWAASVGYRSKIIRLATWPTAGVQGGFIPFVVNGVQGAAVDADTNHGFNSGDFTPGIGGGLAGNGSSKYLDTGVDLHVIGSSDDMGIFVYSTAPGVFTDTDCPMGVYNAVGDRADLSFTNFTAPSEILTGYLSGTTPDGGTGAFVPDDLIGLYGVMGEAGQQARLFHNGASISGPSASSAWALPALGSIPVFAFNLIGNIERHWPGTLGCYVITKGMTVPQVNLMSHDLDVLMQAMGRVA